jgi:hypothetical protein
MQILRSLCSLVMTSKKPGGQECPPHGKLRTHTSQKKARMGHPIYPKCYGALNAPGEDGANDFAFRREDGKVGVGANGDLSLAITCADDARGI